MKYLNDGLALSVVGKNLTKLCQVSSMHVTEEQGLWPLVWNNVPFIESTNMHSCFILNGLVITGNPGSYCPLNVVLNYDFTSHQDLK